MINIDGKELSEKIINGLGKKIKSRRLKLKLAVISVGKNPASLLFVNQKKKACQKIGIGFKFYQFDKKISSSKLKKEIRKSAGKIDNSGIVIQLPLPQKFLAEDFLNLIPEEKDIDVLSEKSLGKFYQGVLNISPPTVEGISRLFKKYKIELRGKNIVVVGAGKLVGFPLAIKLLKEKATLSVLNEFTKDTPFFTKKADIIISAVGKPNLLKGNMVKRGVIIIDAGTIVKRGKLAGDVDYKSVSKKASYISPVPGGVGPMTVACLLENLLKLNNH